MGASISSGDWLRQLQARLPERLLARTWHAPLEDWLQSWHQGSLDQFCRPLSGLEPLGPEVASTPRWVVAVLPEPMWAQGLAESTTNPLLLASSRIGNWSDQTDLAPVVRQLLTQSPTTAGCLVTGDGMTCRSLSIHASHYFGLPCWEWLPGEQKSWRSWIDQVAHACQDHSLGTRHARLFVTPSFEQDSQPIPAADRLAFASAEQIFLLSVRSGGHTWQLAQDMMTKRPATGRVRIFLPPWRDGETNSWAQHRQAAHQLMESGAIGWHLATPTIDTERETLDQHALPRPAKSFQETRSPQVQWLEPGSSTLFLSHHTRSNPQQWPEEVEGDFWWRWLSDGAHGCWPWETILRIACQQKLRAGHRLIPGQLPVVCFSGRCPVETAALRTFRPHLRRWDYEPYGIAIQKSWLEQQGARRVEYVEQGSPVHPFQQIRYSKGSTTSRVDWSLEQEYRFPGDLDLRTVPRDAMFYFVRTSSEAQQLAGYTSSQVKFLERES
jgi:hypothetical protein